MDEDYSKTNPAQLMQLAKGGNTQAFAALYDLYFSPIYRYIYLRVRHRQETENLTQEVFLKIYNSIDQFQEQGKEPIRYFLTVAKNAVIDRSRKNRPSEVEITEAIANGAKDGKTLPQEELILNEEYLAISKAVKSLTSDQQEIIALKFFLGLKNRDISEIMGKSEEAVRQSQSRALKSLKKYFDSQKPL